MPLRRAFWAFILSCLLPLFSASSQARPLVVMTTFAEAPIRALMESFHHQHPDIQVQVIYRRTAQAARIMQQPELQPIDLVISSSPIFFHQLSQAQLLGTLPAAYAIPDWLAPHSLALSEQITVLGYSGIGLMTNAQYLKKHGLPTPKCWQDLTNPIFAGHLTMSTPANSGTTHMMVESILQQMGWRSGWQLLMQLGGNMGAISARSFGVSDAVARGLVGAGPVIDNYAFNAKSQLPFIEFHYLDNTVILPTYIAIAKASDHAEKAKVLLDFLRSPQGQRIIDQGQMAKVPVHDDSLAKHGNQVLDEGQLYRRAWIIHALYDATITRQLPLLQQAWRQIYQVEAHYTAQGASKAQWHQLAHAKALASEVPITSTQAQQLAEQKIFEQQAQRRVSAQAAQQKLAWQMQVRDNLSQSIQLTNQLAQAHKHD